MPAQHSNPLSLYRCLYRIRRFEETVLDNFAKGVFFGTTHTYLGQEANATGVLSHLQENDIVFSNHRCHGHFLAYGGEPRALFAELMGKATGVCGGRGGSQHLHWKNFYSNGIQGGILPVAAGMALAEKLKKSDTLCVVFLGDGTFGEGVVYETLNMVSLWQVPLLMVVENNRIAQTTPIELALAGNLAARIAAFAIPVVELETADVMEIQSASRELFDQVRQRRAPRALVLHTNRFGPHSKGDDTRPAEVVRQLWEQHDPLRIHAQRLSNEELGEVEDLVNAEIESAFQQAMADPYPALEKGEAG